MIINKFPVAFKLRFLINIVRRLYSHPGQFILPRLALKT